MMKKLDVKKISLTVLAIAALAFPLASLTFDSAAAQSPEESLCTGSGGTWKAATDKTPASCSNGSTKTVGGTFQQIADVLIFIVGGISVIMIIVGGLRYTISAGDQSKVTSAKNTVLYALIGVVLAFLSYAIVNFVLVRFKII